MTKTVGDRGFDKHLNGHYIYAAYAAYSVSTMLTGEVVFVSEPVFRGQPVVSSPGIYHDGETVMVVTGDGAIYAYESDDVLVCATHGDYIAFNRDGIHGTLHSGLLCGKRWNVPIDRCESLADMMTTAYNNNDEYDCEHVLLVDVMESENYILIVTEYCKRIIHIRIMYA